jgi:hypothetical protein
VIFPGGGGGGWCIWLITLPFFFLNPGSLNLLKPSAPIYACRGIDLYNYWRLLACGVWRRLVWYICSDVSHKPAEYVNHSLLCWKFQVPSKRKYAPASVQGITFQDARIFSGNFVLLKEMNEMQANGKFCVVFCSEGTLLICGPDNRTSWRGFFTMETRIWLYSIQWHYIKARNTKET